MADIAPYSILVLSILMLVGGIIGFKKANSKASLISGVVSAIILAGCFAMVLTKAGGSASTGLFAAFAFTFALDAVFAIRLSKTKKFMPAGMLLIFIAITQVILAMALFVNPNANGTDVSTGTSSPSAASPSAATQTSAPSATDPTSTPTSGSSATTTNTSP